MMTRCDIMQLSSPMDFYSVDAVMYMSQFIDFYVFKQDCAQKVVD